MKRYSIYPESTDKETYHQKLKSLLENKDLDVYVSRWEYGKEIYFYSWSEKYQRWFPCELLSERWD